MRALGWRRAAVVAALAGTAACTAIAGLDGNFVNDGTTADDSGTKTDGAPTQKDGQVATEDAPSSVDDGGKDGGTDSDLPDNFVPFDACSVPSDAGPAPSIFETHAAKCPASDLNRIFCWDFNDPKSAPTWGWDRRTDTAEAGSTLVVDGTSAATQLHITIGAGAAAGSSQSLVNVDWFKSTGAIDQLDYPNNVHTRISATFSVKSANRRADIVTLAFADTSFGIAVYPDPCGGAPHLGLVDEESETFRGGAVIAIDSWYQAVIDIVRRDDNTWRAEAFVGAQSLGSHDPAFPGGLMQKVDAGLGFGLSNLGDGGGAEVVIDDVLYVNVP